MHRDGLFFNASFIEIQIDFVVILIVFFEITSVIDNNYLLENTVFFILNLKK
jgi:hypothetical protein